MKKALCLILSVLLVVLSFPVTALAGEDDNKFRVHYSLRAEGEDEHQITFVKVNGVNVGQGETKEFVKSSPITFTLIRPEEWETPVVEIEVYDGDEDTPNTVWRSDYEEGNVIEINDDEFTFTPTSYDYFDVFVYWNKYEAFECGERNYCVEISGVENGAIEFSETYVDSITDGWNTKYAFPVETNVTLTFTPNDGYEVSCIYADWKYCNDPSEEWEKQLSKLYNSEKQCYEYTIFGAAEGEEYYAYAEFELRSEGVFRVHYDGGWYDEDDNLIAYVKVGGKTLEDGAASSFETNAPVTFTIVHPDDEDIKVVVKIEDNKGNVWRSDYAAGNPNKIDISGNEFTFTPKSDNNFSVYVYWNEYGAFDCGEGNYFVEYDTNDYLGGTTEFSKEPEKFITNGWNTKSAFPINEDLTVYLIPNENYELSYVSFNGEHVYSKITDMGESSITDLDYNEAENCYEFKITADTVQEGERYSIYVEYEMSSEHAYQIEYDEQYDEDWETPVAYVEVGNDIVDSYSVCAFENAGTPIEFTMVPPKNRSMDTPIVEIEVYDGNEDTPNTIWRSDFAAGNEHKINITGNKFSFTPTTEDSFIVRIWWSDFDVFDCGEGKYTIHTVSDGNGSYRFSKTPENILRHGNEAKYVFPVDEEVKVAFVPNGGYELDNVTLYEWLVYNNDPGTDSENLSDLYNANTKCYEYVFEIDLRNEGEDLYLEAQYKKTETKRKNNSVVTIGKKAADLKEENPDTGAFVG